MFDLMMVYCLSGKPCAVERLAVFEQEDVAETLCNVARPAIESFVLSKASSSASVTFSCRQNNAPDMPDYLPRKRKDDKVMMLKPELLLDVIDRVSN
jgi:hypothetical protein